jgi:hypothetical protein
MARYNDNECAHCAEDLELTHCLIGRDWKVYCCETCRTAGEAASQAAMQQWMQRTPVHSRHAPTETTAKVAALSF